MAERTDHLLEGSLREDVSGTPETDQPEQTTLSEGETGIEEEDLAPTSEITEPFDPSQIRVETKALTVDLLLSRIDQNEIDLAPDFQRKAGIWKADAKSRLIESILIRIPLPAFYMDATEDNRWLVVDGLQRLSTLKSFALDHSLKLSGLEFLPLNGKTYPDLPRHLQRRIRETQVTVYLIEKGTPPLVKFNIFKRINTGGLPLSTQEIRHALNQGPATEMLRILAASPEFLAATAYGIKDDRMADRECVLRFLAFSQIDPGNYREADFDAFLSAQMAALNAMTQRQRDALSASFLRSMVAAREIFSQGAFRKPTRTRSPINKPLLEAWSVNLSQQTDENLALLIERREAVAALFHNTYLNDYEFDQSISASTGDPRKVARRFAKVRGIIDQVVSQ